MPEIRFRDPKESKAQIDAFAHKVLRRLKSLGAASHTLDDVQQELWVAWCKACEAYDPQMGASFKTFLYLGMQRHINRYVETHFERFHGQTVALSLDATVEDGGETFASVVPDQGALQDAVLEQESNFAYAMSRLSPRAQKFLAIVREQPEGIIQEFRKFESKSEYAKQQGIHFAAPQRLASWLIFDLMGVSRPDRKLILDEITQLGEKLTSQAGL